jgi:hypothetical protein
MPDLLLIGALIGGAIVLAAGPLLLPWPWKVRWMVTAETVNPLIAVSNAHHHVQLEEVALVSFTTGPAALELVVEPDGADAGRARTTLVGSAPSPGELAALDGWYAGRTPLLLVEDSDGLATLQGPHRVITGLHEPHHDAASTLA